VIVVSDTTPLNYLVLINAIDVLPKLFQRVYAPHAVLRELRSPKAPDAVRRWADSPPSWLNVVDPASRLPSTDRLDPGEADAISLAKENHILDILMDERRGSKIAIREGLFPLPTLAVLERAAERNLLDLRAALERLQLTTIRIPRQHIIAAIDREIARKLAQKPTK
jgi:predicted nucleic acid-binding protein